MSFLRIIPVIIEVASICGWLTPIVAALQLSQRVVQALGFETSELLQIPYITEEIAQKFMSHGVSTVNDLRDKGCDENGDVFCKQIIGIENEENKWLEICDAANRYPSISVQAQKVSATSINIHLQRDIDEDESIGPVFAPYFSIKKNENWWLVLVDQNNNVIETQRISFEREANVTIEVSSDLISTQLKVYTLCDSYIGCDLACDVV